MVSSSPLSKFTRDSRPAAGAIVWEGRTITSLLVILPSLHKNHNFHCLLSPSWHPLVPTSSQMPVREHVKARLAESPVILGLGGRQTGLDRPGMVDGGGRSTIGDISGTSAPERITIPREWEWKMEMGMGMVVWSLHRHLGTQ